MKVTMKYMPKVRTFSIRVHVSNGMEQTTFIKETNINQVCRVGLSVSMGGVGILNIPAEVCRKAVGKPNKVIEISLADLGYEQHVETPSKPVSRIRAWWDKVARKVAEWSLRITG